MLPHPSLYSGCYLPYFKHIFMPLSSPKQFPACVNTTTFLIFENCFRVALISARMRASAPVPGDWEARQNCTVAVAFSGFGPFMSNVTVKSGPPPVGLEDDEQLEGPLRILLNSEKYPELRSLSVGPAIKSWMENVATATVGEMRSTGNTALKLFSESGVLEKYTFTG